MDPFKTALLIAAASLFLSAACDPQDKSGEAPPEGALPPVETQAPNTSYKPAFEGQTRASGATTAAAYEAQVIADGLSSPWAVAALPEIYSYGHRNPQGLAIHPVTGGLWLSEMGPRGGDELNLIKPGADYGWPAITYGIEYSGQAIGDGITQKEGMEQPVYYWDPVLSPSGMAFYTSNAIPEWEHNLFICGLSSQHIARLIIDNNRVVGEERLLAEKGERFRDIADGPDGALYAVTDGGRLYRIGVKKI